MRIGLVGGYKFEPTYSDGAWQQRPTFFVLRPFLGGNFFREWIHFWTSVEFASNPPYLLDSYVELAPSKCSGFASASSSRRSSPRVLRSPGDPIPRVGAGQRVLWSGRDKGITALGTLAEQLDYWLGLYSGTPLRQFNAIPGNYVFEADSPGTPRPQGRTEFPYIVSEGPAPFRVSGTLQGYYGKSPVRDRELQPVDLPLRGEARPARPTRKAAEARTSGCKALVLLLRRRLRRRTGRPARRSLRWASGRKSACRSSPRRWTSRRVSTG